MTDHATRLLPKQQTGATVRSNSYDPETRTIELSWGKGAPVLRRRMFDADYVEQLDMAGADLANADVWNANFSQVSNRPASVQEALIEPFVVRDRR